MSIFDIVGPVMVGPSSSHTAGAVRIGYICYKLMDEPIRKVKIGLYGSFWRQEKEALQLPLPELRLLNVCRGSYMNEPVKSYGIKLTAGVKL